MHGYKRGYHDPRDLPFSAHPAPAGRTPLPKTATTRTIYKPPIRNQLSIGSCTANAGCAAAGFLYHVETKKADPRFSRLDLYAITRELEGTPLTEDSGASVRDVFKAMARFGVCLEHTWPYIETRFDVQPSRLAMAEARHHKAITYLRCQSLTDIKQSIADGFPVIGGFTCYESIDSDATSQTGDIYLPQPGEPVVGGHCVMFDSFDDVTSYLGFQNSWGPEWGTGGYGRLPYGYVTGGYAEDFWTIRRIATA
jgi:C1A family cysteine protease